jgi:Yip1 domain
MNLVERAKNIVLQPKSEWNAIEPEQTTTAELYTGYVIPLVAIGAIALFIGYSFVGLPFLGRMPMGSGLSMAVLNFIMGLISVFIIAWIINMLAPTFGAQQNMMQALKVAAYSYTPAWLAGVLQILPMLGILILFASLYSLYLLYLGLQSVMKAPAEKAVPYTIVVIIAAIVLSMILGAIMATIGGGMMGGMMKGAIMENSRQAGGTGSASKEEAEAALAKLKELADKMKEAGK